MENTKDSRGKVTNPLAATEAHDGRPPPSAQRNHATQGESLRQKASRKLHGEGANPSQLGDPISIKAESSDTVPTDEEAGASGDVRGSEETLVRGRGNGGKEEEGVGRSSRGSKLAAYVYVWRYLSVLGYNLALANFDHDFIHRRSLRHDDEASTNR
ncbi:hypothetical protein N3K66_000413 [Trichothecium roseum]|uniref:Uncharacterized protein n=1 Tax=Trichothecium roseum TaxID=47278 RepID=A0ACC0VCG1_9HYPO|nr:hypothetical protein N3K66_000413 [Trichothecium roseum]